MFIDFQYECLFTKGYNEILGKSWKIQKFDRWHLPKKNTPRNVGNSPRPHPLVKKLKRSDSVLNEKNCAMLAIGLELLTASLNITNINSSDKQLATVEKHWRQDTVKTVMLKMLKKTRFKYSSASGLANKWFPRKLKEKTSIHPRKPGLLRCFNPWKRPLGIIIISMVEHWKSLKPVYYWYDIQFPKAVLSWTTL